MLSNHIPRESFCRSFELTQRIPKPVVDDALSSARLKILDKLSFTEKPFVTVLDHVQRFVESCRLIYFKHVIIGS